MSNASPQLKKSSEPGRRNLGRWVVTVCWAGLIFYFSTGGFGSSFTYRLLSAVLQFLHVSVSPATFDVLHFLLRKSAHLTEYGIFSLLIYASLLHSDRFEWQPRKVLWSVLIAGGYSLTDEFHQMFVPGRTAALHDCAIDTAGAIVAMLLVLAGNRLSGRRNRARTHGRVGETAVR